MTLPNYSLTKSWTVSEVYGTCDLKIPPGYRVLAFRLPKREEPYLSAVDGRGVMISQGLLADPRLILQKHAVVTFTYLRTGSPRAGEWYRHTFNDFFYKAGVDLPQLPDVDVYERTES